MMELVEVNLVSENVRPAKAMGVRHLQFCYHLVWRQGLLQAETDNLLRKEISVGYLGWVVLVGLGHLEIQERILFKIHIDVHRIIVPVNPIVLCW